MICSISGQVPTDPVVSPRGHLFERKLIEKVLLEEGKCPVSGEEMSRSDLITIQSQAAVRPKDMSTASIPSMLQAMQSEWDEVMLETFTLKQALDQTRRELSQALYQHDAACRVIARLMRERDEARAMLSAKGNNVDAPSAPSTTATSSSSSSGNGNDMEVEGDSSTTDWSAASTKMSEKMTSLAADRRGRKNTALVGAIPSITEETTFKKIFPGNTKKSKYDGITCMATQPVVADANSSAGSAGNFVLTGHSNGTIVCTALSGKNSTFTKIAAAHDSVSQVSFGVSQPFAPFFSAGLDGFVKIWNGKTSPSCSASLQPHGKTGIFCLKPHPVSDYLITMGGESWACVDVNRGQVIRQAPNAPANVECSAGGVHPDGLLMASAGVGSMRLWDVRDGDGKFSALDCGARAGRFSCMAFSENGYYLAATDGEVQLFDLRKMKIIKDFSGPSAAKSVSFDYSGQKLAIGWEGKHPGTLLSVKEWTATTLLGQCESCMWNGAGDAQQLLTSSGGAELAVSM